MLHVLAICQCTDDTYIVVRFIRRDNGHYFFLRRCRLDGATFLGNDKLKIVVGIVVVTEQTATAAAAVCNKKTT